jgi:insulysin
VCIDPHEDEFDAFLGEHGGSSNAHTDGEETCYVFDVEAEHLEHAMDMFADLIAAPLLREEG